MEVKIGNVKLQLVPENERYPQHLTWKRALEREWAGDWGTLASLTGYAYKMALDPSFFYERPKFRKGEIQYYEWILCRNGGVISLYDAEARLGKVWTSKALGEKILVAIPGTRVFRTSDEFLYYDIIFPLEHIHQVCELAGARKARRLSETQKTQLRARALARGLGSPSTHLETPKRQRIL